MRKNYCNASRLELCRKCLQLCGTVLLEKAEYMQLCACRSPRVRRNLEMAPGRDFAAYVELCYCCGLEAISSGSRWSRFFCSYCHDAIAGPNRIVGSPLIPVGRHSLMNSVSLSGKNMADRKSIDSFVMEICSLNSSIDALYEWRKLTVARRCAELGFEGDKNIPFGLYLRKGISMEKNRIKRGSVRELCAFFESPDRPSGDISSRRLQ